MSLFSRLFCALVLVCISASAAMAEGYGLYEYSARGVALGGTVVARKPDASSVAYNPALLARLPGTHIMGGLSFITPVGKMDTEDAYGNKDTTALKPSTWLIPHAYFTHQINDDFTFGVGEFSRFGLGFEYPHNWPGRFNIYEVNLKSLSFNPNIAWAATDKLSLAAGVEILYVALDLKKRAMAPVYDQDYNIIGGMEVDSNIQDATDTGLGWNLAAHYQFNDQWAVGLSYRSQVRVHAKGEVEYTMMGQSSPSMAAAQGTFQQMFRDGKAHSTVILPDSYTGGISYTPFPELSFELSAAYTRWSSFRDLNIHLPEPIGESRNSKHWKDVWRIGFGVEYSPLDWLTLRAAYMFDQSPMEGRQADYLVPTKDRDIWSAGLGFSWENWDLDLAYMLIAARQRTYAASDETHVMKGKTHNDNTTHVVTVSLSYSF